MKGSFFAGLALGALIGAVVFEAKPEALNIIKERKENKPADEQNKQN